MDHQVKSIQDYIAPKTLNDYYCVDLALHSDNIWQTKMLRMQQDTMSYFRDPVDPNSPEIRSYMDHINREMRGVLHMWPD
jgi:S-adenosylmethionine decarboxylase